MEIIISAFLSFGNDSHLLIYTMENYIISDPEILTGKPIVRGTRLSVEFILGLVANGWDEKTIIDSYPGLTKDSIRAAVNYAREIVQDELYYHKAQ